MLGDSIAFIPARGGSSGISRKNIVDLGGIPLIAWSILAAREAQEISRVIVSTDDEEIADISREYGAEVPFLRPPELASANADLAHVTSHCEEFLRRNGTFIDVFLTLFPTHPFRSPTLIDELVQVSRKFGQDVSIVETINWSANHWFTKSSKQTSWHSIQSPENALLGKIIGTGICRTYTSVLDSHDQHIDHLLGAAIEQSMQKDEKWSEHPALSRCVEAAYSLELEKSPSGISVIFPHPDAPRPVIAVHDEASLVDIDEQSDLEEARKLLSRGEVSWIPKQLSKNASFDTPPPKVAIGEEQKNISLSVWKYSGTDLTLKEKFHCAQIPAPTEFHSKYSGEECGALILAVDSMTESEVVSFRNTAEKFQELPLLQLISSSPAPVNSWHLYELLEEKAVFHSGSSPQIVSDYFQLKSGPASLIISCSGIEPRDEIRLSYFPTYNHQCPNMQARFRFDGSEIKMLSSESSKNCDLEVSTSSKEILLQGDSLKTGISIVDILRPGTHSSENLVIADPFEIPGAFSFHRGRRRWVEESSDKTILGRQDLPPVFRWSGFAYLPAAYDPHSGWFALDERGELLP